MRIAQPPGLLVAVLHLAAAFLSVSCRTPNNSSLDADRHQHHHQHASSSSGGGGVAHEDTWSGRWLTTREAQLFLRQEGGDDDRPVDCCPSVMEMVLPEAGINEHGLYVELFHDGDNRQGFYEISCMRGVEGRPCRFMDKKLHNQSRCEQKYSFTYALVKDVPGAGGRHAHHRPVFPAHGPKGSDWKLDYIKVRSGCSCVVTPKRKVKKSKKTKKSRSKRPTEPQPDAPPT